MLRLNTATHADKIYVLTAILNTTYAELISAKGVCLVNYYLSALVNNGVVQMQR